MSRPERGSTSTAPKAAGSAPVPMGPLAALGRLEGEAAQRLAAYTREVAMTLPGGSTLRSDLLDAALELRALAHSHGVPVSQGHRSARTGKR